MVISKNKGLHLNSVSYFSIFVPKARCSLKKRSSPKFGNYFLQLIIVTALKFLTLPKFFISLPEMFWFFPNIVFSCHCPKNFNFAQILETWGAIAPCAPGRYGYAFPYLQSLLYFVFNYNQLFFWMQIKTNCCYYYYFNNLQCLGRRFSTYGPWPSSGPQWFF